MSDTTSAHGLRSPSSISARGWWDVLKATAEEFSNDRVLLVAAGVTFYSLLALVPALAAFVAVYGLFFDPQDVARQVDMLGGLLPGSALEILREQATRIASQSGGTLGLASLVGFAVSLWSANAGMKAIIEALNVVYEAEEKRSFVTLNLQSLALTLGLLLVALLLIAAIAVVPAMLALLAPAPVVAALISIGRWLLMLAVVVTLLAVLYRYAPSREKPEWRWITWGGSLAAVTWIVLSILFSWYVSNFASYNETYGSLGAVIAFLTWLWLSTTVVLLGAELNAVIERKAGRRPGRPDGRKEPTPKEARR